MMTVILKTDVAGSEEAIRQALESFPADLVCKGVLKIGLAWLGVLAGFSCLT